MEVEAIFRNISRKNKAAGDVAFFCGAGAYRHHVPAMVDHIIQRSEFLTSYTPYQPEITQGTLQTLFEFQTQVATLFGVDIANASMYDGSTAAGEAVLMAHRITKRKKAVLSAGLHPHYAKTIETLSYMSAHKVCSQPIDLFLQAKPQQTEQTTSLETSPTPSPSSSPKTSQTSSPTTSPTLSPKAFQKTSPSSSPTNTSRKHPQKYLPQHLPQHLCEQKSLYLS